MRHYLLFSAIAAAGCTNSFPPYSFVHSLSVLAVQAEPPELGPGESAQLRALIADPAGRAVQLRWDACTLAPDPGVGQDVNPRCLEDASAPYLIPLGQGDTASVTMPMVGPTDLGFPDDTDGVYLPVRLIAEAGADRVTAVYRVRYHIAGPSNHNPKLTDLTRDPAADGGVGAPLPDGTEVGQGDSLTLRPSFDPGSAEGYFILDLTTRMPVARTELLRASWFVSAGKLSEEHTGEERPDTVWTLGERLPEARPAPIDLWLVVRDERGGTDFTHRSLTLR